MRRGILIGVTLFGCLLVQVAVLPALGVTNIAPDLILAVLIPCAILWNGIGTAFFGAAIGLLLDILVGKGIGQYALFYLIVPWIITQFRSGYFHENPVLPALMAGVACLAREILIALMIYLGRMEIAITAQLALRSLVSTLLTAGLTVPFYLVLYGIMNRQSRRGDGVMTFGR